MSASPEMYVRVEGKRIETCPICGTIRRGRDALEDAERIRELLNSVKDESELTMCTDVDRNDKSRVCVPGSVKVIGRRQIEKLVRTAEHLEEDGVLIVEVGESERALAALLPGVPFNWIEFQVGQMGVFLLDRDDLVVHAEAIVSAANARAST